MPLATLVNFMRLEPPAWTRQAACAGHDLNLWFPDAGDRDSLAKARTICGQCPVATDCLMYAINNDIRHGVWGGKSSRERAKIRHTLVLKPC